MYFFHTKTLTKFPQIKLIKYRDTYRDTLISYRDMDFLAIPIPTEHTEHKSSGMEQLHQSTPPSKVVWSQQFWSHDNNKIAEKS